MTDDEQIIELIRGEYSHLKDSRVRQMDSVMALLAELPKLRDAAKMLAALEAAGVDNWEGYSHAQELMEE